MRLSLRVQLGLTIVLVTMAVVVLVLASSRRRLVEEFYRFDGGGDTTFVARARERLEAWYPYARSSLLWRGADSVLAAIPRPHGLEFVLLSPAGIVVAASRADLRAAKLLAGEPARPLDRAPNAPQPEDRASTVLTFRDGGTGALVRLLFDSPPRRDLHRADGRFVGRVYSFKFQLPPGPERQRILAQSARPGWLTKLVGPRRSWQPRVDPETQPPADLVGRILVAPLLLGALVSIVLLLLATSRALSPLRELTAATQRLAGGDRTARVPVSGSTEVATLAESFNAMADSLERAEAVRRQMVSDVAHELRTPITNLRCRLEAMQDGLAAPDAAELRGLHGETLLLQRLVEDLQLLSLADAGRLALHVGAADLREIAGSAVASFAAQAGAQGVALVLEPGPAAPLACDAVRIAQALRNLIANALAHTTAGGSVRVRVTREGGEACCAVVDSGSGITAEQLPHVFDRFWRADAARTREQGGAGLGLAIVRELVGLHRGTVSVTSAPGEGATFVMRLPAA